MICPECGQTFKLTDEYILHLIEQEGLTSKELYSGIVTMGLLTNEEVDSYYGNI
jgi:hypothetical protein|tara:strand:+ start:556 stop:717 length:162 start_codon:yes stop_codon:yes gene_type:complete